MVPDVEGPPLGKVGLKWYGVVYKVTRYFMTEGLPKIQYMNFGWKASLDIVIKLEKFWNFPLFCFCLLFGCIILDDDQWWGEGFDKLIFNSRLGLTRIMQAHYRHCWTMDIDLYSSRLFWQFQDLYFIHFLLRLKKIIPHICKLYHCWVITKRK